MKNNRKRLKAQIEQFIAGMVEGYAESTHCRPEIAELEVFSILAVIVSQYRKPKRWWQR